MSDEISQIILQELREHRAESNKRHESMDKRMRTVELWQSNANGKMSMVGVFGVFLGGLITTIISIVRH